MKNIARLKTLVLGIGNPILSDDGVGLQVARAIKQRLPKLEVRETSEAGLSLLEEIAGFDNLVLIDSIRTGRRPPGALWKLSFSDLKPLSPSVSSHGIGIAGALELGRKLGYQLPRAITVYAVEVENNNTFSEKCTDGVSMAVPRIVGKIMAEENFPTA